MKYVKSFESYKFSRNNSEKVNEEVFTAIKKFFLNLFKKWRQYIDKTNGGQEIEEIYNKYVDKINQEIQKTAKVDIQLMKSGEQLETTPGKEEKPAETKPAEVKKEMLLTNLKHDKIFEADEEEREELAKSKKSIDLLKSKRNILRDIVLKLRDNALQEMDGVLQKKGGALANPQLEVIVKTKKAQFEVDFMNAQIKYLESLGDATDKNEISKLTQERDKLANNINNLFKDFDKLKPIVLKAGDKVIVLLTGKTKEDWNKLSPEEKKKPTEGKAKDIVSVNKISSIEGDNYILEDEKGEPTIKKTTVDLIAPLNNRGDNPDILKDLQVGSKIIYLLKGKTRKDWDTLSDEEKGNPTEGKAKDIVSVSNLTAIEGDEYTVKDSEGKEIKITGNEIVGKSKNNLGELKPGLNVIYKRKEFNEEEWSKLTQDDKVKTDEGKVRELRDKKIIGLKKIKDIKGDVVSFVDSEITKNKSDILFIVPEK